MSAVAEVVEEEEVSFRAWGREAVEQAGGIHKDATEILVNRILADRSILESRIREIVTHWAKTQISMALNAGRGNPGQANHRVVQLVQPVAPRIDGSMMREAMAEESIRFMNRSLWGGKPIGLATADEIYESADNYDKQARTMTRTAAWQAAVAAALEKNGNPGDRCCDCLTESTLASLWEAESGN